jgi:hypothetical protein
MTLSIKGLALTVGILWGACCFLTGIVNLIWPSYGVGFLSMMASLYPGYHGPVGLGAVIVLTFYALVDGLVCGALVAWLYNKLAGSRA